MKSLFSLIAFWFCNLVDEIDYQCLEVFVEELFTLWDADVKMETFDPACWRRRRNKISVEPKTSYLLIQVLCIILLERKTLKELKAATRNSSKDNSKNRRQGLGLERQFCVFPRTIFL